MSTARFHPETIAYMKLVEEHSQRSDAREYTPEHARQERDDVISHISQDVAFDGNINDVSINSNHYPGNAGTLISIGIIMFRHMRFRSIKS